MERRLGRGLGSLLGNPQATSDPEPAEARAPVAPPEAIPPTKERHELPLEQIRPNPDQPRTLFRPEQLEELQTSIGQHGVLQAIVVREVAEDSYQIISGERRFRAAKAAGLASIPVHIREASDEEVLELALVENVQREDLDAIEKALGFQALQESLQLTQEQVAAKVGLKRSTVANHLRLLDLPEAIQKGVAQGLITMGHARALLGIPEKSKRLQVFQQIVRDELSVRATEALIRGGQAPGTSAKGAEAKPAAQAAPWAQDFERRLQSGLGIRAKLVDSADGKYRGRLVLHYHDRDELERLMEHLAPTDQLED